MREIKFRAWHKLNKEMLYEGWTFKESGSEIFSSKTTLFMLGESAELMQYTGLKDKKGKEIYEGDIVQGIGVKEVKWYTSKNFVGFNIGQGFYDKMNLVVIGNIYEHPELLK